MTRSIRRILALAAVALLGMLLGACIYETVVLVPNFAADIPASLEHFRAFMKASNPGNFFRALAPATQLSLLAALVLSWRQRSVRWWYLAALVLAVAVDIVTFKFHYPRNAFLFTAPLTQRPEDLARTVQEWRGGNFVRMALLCGALISALRALWLVALQRAAERSHASEDSPQKLVHP
jgi:uncharacterized membrane protein